MRDSYPYVIVGGGQAGASAVEGIRESYPRGPILLFGAESELLGVIVNEFLMTSDPDIYAAGDIALFPEAGFGPRRLEHWDNAVNQGKCAGRNMAGAHEPFMDIPFFFSDLFEFGYEAVGDIDSRLATFADWQEENKTGVIYYLEGDRLRGAMMCNVWGQVDAARALIQSARRASKESLRGAIRRGQGAPHVPAIVDRNRNQGVAGRSGPGSDPAQSRLGDHRGHLKPNHHLTDHRERRV